MFGSLFYGAVSIRDKDVAFSGQNMAYVGLEYSRDLGKGFAFGVDVDVYQHLPVDKYGPVASEEGRTKSSTSFSAGVYLRINPSFFLKTF